MKISPFYLFVLSAVFLLGNCQSNSTETTVREGLKIGDVFKYRFHMLNEGKVDMGEQEMNNRMEQKQEMGFTVKEKNQAGDNLVDFVMGHIELNMSNAVDGMPMGPAITFNSSTDEVIENPGFMLLKGLIDYPSTIVVNPNGKILSIEGLEEKIDSLFSENTIPGAQQFMEQMKHSFNEEAMKVQLKELMDLSTLDKKIGDSWEEIVDISIIPTILTKLHKTYTLKDRKAGNAVVEVKGTVKVDPTGTVTMGGTKFQYDIEGKLGGEIIVEEKNGWTISSKIEQITSGKMTGTGPSMGGEQTTSFYSEATSKIERL